MSCKGRVKSFNPSRGFGFISDKDGDTFLHEGHCEDGRQPKKGDLVLFDKIPGLGKSCRYEARNVTGGSGGPIQAPAREQAAPHEQPEQRREHAAATTAPTAGGDDVPASSAPAAEALAAGDPSESSFLAERLAADHKDSPADTSADSRKTACAGNFDSMHDAYREFGSEEYYKLHGEKYTNPHEPVISRALVAALSRWAPRLELPLRRVHDLACGSGEASAAFSKIPSFAGCALDASDPYTNAAFEKRMGRPAYRWSFEDIAGGVLEDLQPYDLVIGSFSLHLLTKEWHHTSLSALARSCRMLLVLTPHKQPVIEPSTGWRQIDEVVHERVRVRLYTSDGARRLGQGEAVEHTEHTIICHPPSSSEEQAADDDELASRELADVIREVESMNHHELREALTKRGLSTAGKRGQWADRLLMAVRDAKDPKVGSEACAGMSLAGGRHEADEAVGAEHVGEGVEEEEEESEGEGSSDEETTEDEDDSTLSQSTHDDEDEAAAAAAAKKAAVRAALKARQAAKRPGNRTPHVEKKGDAQEAKKEQGAKAKKEVSFVEPGKVKDTRLQANFGQTKFIKP